MLAIHNAGTAPDPNYTGTNQFACDKPPAVMVEVARLTVHQHEAAHPNNAQYHSRCDTTCDPAITPLSSLCAKA